MNEQKERPYKEEAKQTMELLKKLVANKDGLEVLEAYLAEYYQMLLDRGLNTPEDVLDVLNYYSKLRFKLPE